MQVSGLGQSEHEKEVQSFLSSAVVEVAKCGGLWPVVSHLAWPGQVPQQHCVFSLHSGHTPAAYIIQHEFISVMKSCITPLG